MTSSWLLVCILLILIMVTTWMQFFDPIQRSQEMTFSFYNQTRSPYKEGIHIFHIEANCGLLQPCSSNSVSLFLSTGVVPKNKPSLCVDGKYVIKSMANERLRGLNAAIIEPKNFEVVSVRNFDTYAFNVSVDIAEWINGIADGDILIMFTYDEAYTLLGEETKTLLNELGSGKIQNLQHQSQWYMITQKGTKGFTTYEKIIYYKKANREEAIEFRGCVPRKIPKKITTADEPLKKNRQKLQFCEGKRTDKYKGFCNEERFEIIMPALLTNKSLVGNIAYTLPIYLYASENLELLIASIDSLIHQPGITLSLVTVLYENNVDDLPNLAKIYGMGYNKIKFVESFEKKLSQARKIAKKVYPLKKYLIVIDADVIPSPDFLFFMAQILPVLEKDQEVSTISGWSSNCYKEEGSVHLAYRIRGIPKYAALLSMKKKINSTGEIFAPDVARVQGPEICHLPSLEPDNWIERPQDLLKSRYFHKMVMLQQLSQVIDANEILDSCSKSCIKNDTNAIYLSSDNTKKSKMLNCLGVMNNQYGEYEGIVRLFVGGKTVLVITSNSSFYKSRPIVPI